MQSVPCIARKYLVPSGMPSPSPGQNIGCQGFRFRVWGVGVRVGGTSGVVPLALGLGNGWKRNDLFYVATLIPGPASHKRQGT